MTQNNTVLDTICKILVEKSSYDENIFQQTIKCYISRIEQFIELLL